MSTQAQTQTQQTGRKRLVHQLDTPFSTISWPEISLEDQDTILELLCYLLEPIGKHRQNHIKPSKGKRAAKRAKESGQDPEPSEPPAKPAVADNLDVGFNSITRALQSQSTASESKDCLHSMIFVARGNQTSSFNNHFPQMVAVASQGVPHDMKPRLVGFSKPCAERLSEALGIARVSAIAVRGNAPGASGLLDFVREKVAPMDASWLSEKAEINYLPTKINSLETTVGSKRAKMG